MRRYHKFRIVVLAALLVASVFVFSGTGLAQGANGGAAAAADPNAPAVKPVGTLDSFGILLRHPDFVSITILLLSIVGLTLIVQGFIKARAAVMFPEASTDHIRDLISQRQFKELIEFTETDPSFVSKALNPALKRAPSFAAMKEAMETSIGEQTADQFRRIEYLNVIGNLGPLLGLLGTVIGMIVAFEEMSRSGGQANPAQLSGGISKALAHTMAGLILALPCLAAFGILRTMIDRLTIQGALIAEELLLMVKPAEAKPAAAAAAVAGRPGVGAPITAPAAPAMLGARRPVPPPPPGIAPQAQG
jgi:biopolymer transport protein ExbB